IVAAGRLTAEFDPDRPIGIVALGLFGGGPAIANIVDQAYVHYISRTGRPPGPMLDGYRTRVSDGMVWVVEEGLVIAAMSCWCPRRTICSLCADHLQLRVGGRGRTEV